MKESYHVISTSEDGVSVYALSKEDLEKRLAEQYWGDKKILNELPSERDPGYWGSCIVIIKGSVVVPQPVKVVEEYRLP